MPTSLLGASGKTSLLPPRQQPSGWRQAVEDLRITGADDILPASPLIRPPRQTPPVTIWRIGAV
jgi:hypothetical protein